MPGRRSHKQTGVECHACALVHRCRSAQVLTSGGYFCSPFCPPGLGSGRSGFRQQLQGGQLLVAHRQQHARLAGWQHLRWCRTNVVTGTRDSASQDIYSNSHWVSTSRARLPRIRARTSQCASFHWTGRRHEPHLMQQRHQRAYLLSMVFTIE